MKTTETARRWTGFLRWENRLATVLVAAAVLLGAGCESDDDDKELPGDVNLGIADRAWAPGHDDVGWCGETCIQMAMAYYGREVSQDEINRAAGSPSDITETDLDIALGALGVSYEAWPDSNGNVNQFIEWIKSQLAAGRPVICGTKIYPDENPDWYVDHFVLAVGYGEGGLLLNTQLDCDGQQWVSYEQLMSWDEGYSFLNDQDRCFGRSITGVP
jgi:hypothetical protein